MIDDPVPFCRIDRQDGIHGGQHFRLIVLMHLHGRTHKWDGIMRFRWGVRADMGGDNDVAFQDIPFFLHIQQLGGDGKNCACAIPVRDKSSHDRPCSQAAEPADDTQRGRGSAG